MAGLVTTVGSHWVMGSCISVVCLAALLGAQYFSSNALIKVVSPLFRPVQVPLNQLRAGNAAVVFPYQQLAPPVGNVQFTH